MQEIGQKLVHSRQAAKVESKDPELGLKMEREELEELTSNRDFEAADVGGGASSERGGAPLCGSWLRRPVSGWKPGPGAEVVSWGCKCKCSPPPHTRPVYR